MMALAAVLCYGANRLGGWTMKLLRLMLVGFALAAALPAVAQTLPIPLVTGPQDVSQMRGTFNTLINNINNVLRPIFPAAGAVNSIALTGGATGTLATISLAAGADANASIGLVPNGNGDIILWAGNPTSLGTLQFANAASFVPAEGLGACPGVDPAAPPYGVEAAITGYISVKDWLGVTRALPAC